MIESIADALNVSTAAVRRQMSAAIDISGAVGAAEVAGRRAAGQGVAETSRGARIALAAHVVYMGD